MRYVKKYKPFLWPKSTFWRGILSFPVELEQMWFSLSSFRVLFTTTDDRRRQVRQQRQRTLWKFGSAGAWRRPVSLTPGWLANARDMLNQSEGVYGQRFRVSQHSVTPQRVENSHFGATFYRSVICGTTPDRFQWRHARALFPAGDKWWHLYRLCVLRLSI